MLFVLRFLPIFINRKVIWRNAIFTDLEAFANPFMVKTRDHWGETPKPSLVSPTPYTTTQSLSTIQDFLDLCWSKSWHWSQCRSIAINANQFLPILRHFNQLKTFKKWKKVFKTFFCDRQSNPDQSIIWINKTAWSSFLFLFRKDDKVSGVCLHWE